MKRYLYILFCLSLTACAQTESNSTSTKTPPIVPDQETLLKQIEDLEGELRGEIDAKLNKERSLKLIEVSQQFAIAYPKHPKAGDILFRSADVARGVGAYGVAIKDWGTLHRDYPDHPKAPDAIFLQAFTYENDLQDLDNASRYYDRFMKTYPDHPLAEQAKVLKENLGKSPEELIKSFEQAKEQ